MSKNAKLLNEVSDAMAAAEAARPLSDVADAAARIGELKAAAKLEFPVSQVEAGLKTVRQHRELAMGMQRFIGSMAEGGNRWKSVVQPFGLAHSQMEFLSGLHRQLDTIAASTRLIGGANAFSGFGRQLDDIAGSARLMGGASALSALKADLGSVRTLMGSSAFADMIGHHAKLGRFHEGLGYRELVAERLLGRLPAELGLAFSDTLSSQLTRMADFHSKLTSFLPNARHAAWSAHLSQSAFDSLNLLSEPWDSPVGLMTAPDDADGALVTWIGTRRGGADVKAAAIVPDAGDADDAVPVISEGHCICAICEGPLMTLGTSLRWFGSSRGTRHRRIFPICSCCWLREEEDPGFMFRALADLTRPSLSVIRGGRAGDGKSRATLHLVPTDRRSDT